MAKKLSILLVEDEANLRSTLKLNFEMEGFEVTTANDGVAALKAVQQEYFDLLILDVMLPEIDGITVCENIRLSNTEMPILMLSAKNQSADRILGLKKGADDYLTKPFSLEELLIRVNLLINKSQRIGEMMPLTKKEAMLLKLLIENRNEVVPREKILQAVWGYNVYPTTRTVDNFILNFRKYFEEDSRNPKYFHSVRGVGYKFTYS